MITLIHALSLKLDKIFSRRQIETFSYFSQKTSLDISCKLSPLETSCMKCLILLSRKIKKNVINLSSAVLDQRVVKVKENKITSRYRFCQYGFYLPSEDRSTRKGNSSLCLVASSFFLKAFSKGDRHPGKQTFSPLKQNGKIIYQLYQVCIKIIDNFRSDWFSFKCP